MFVIGTAGHVDHGKSTLVEALTGTHPDRLQEERERGLTIELGFAWCALPSGREVSVVDVPGHVRFVRHMLAGIGAVDLALIVIAADEGLMPQTREHLDILELLGVRRGVVALTKCDLPDAEWLDLVEAEVRDALAETTFAEAPLVRVSATTGAGLDDLRAALDRALDGCPPPRDIGRPRVGIDRVFTMPGFGTVVTGTLLDGALHTDDTLEAVPDGPQGRVRGLQTHQQTLEQAEPGSRVAVNLAGVAVDQLRRGQVLAPPGAIEPARTLDIAVRALPDRPLRHNLRVTLHLGVGEVQARLRVLGTLPATGASAEEPRDEIAAGTSGWAQLVLTEPIAALVGDRCVLRVSDQTVGGGSVVAINPPRHRRSDPEVTARLAARAAGTTESRVLAALDRTEPATALELIEAVVSGGEATAAEVETALAGLLAGGEVVRGPQSDGEETTAIYYSHGGRERLVRQAVAVLGTFHREYPLRFGMPAGELRGRLPIAAERFRAVLPLLAPEVTDRGGELCLDGWEPQPTQAQRQAIEQIAERLTTAALQPPRLAAEVDPEIVRHLIGAGRAIDCGDDVVLAPEAFAEARRRVAAMFDAPATGTATAGSAIGHAPIGDSETGEPEGPDGPSVRLAEVRDALGTNRRTAQAIVERLDRLGVTERRDDRRVAGPALRRGPAQDEARG